MYHHGGYELAILTSTWSYGLTAFILHGQWFEPMTFILESYVSHQYAILV